MTHYRYRIQVGKRYTYRSNVVYLDRLIHDLLEGDPDSKLTEKPKPVPAKEILITVEVVRHPEENWHPLK
jgi:hypothetical protein